MENNTTTKPLNQNKMENIKANELRIGNFIQNNKGSNFFVNPNHLIVMMMDVNHNYNPIPLTEQWLLKFGFEVYEFDNGQPNQYRLLDRILVIRDNKIVDYGSSVVLDYVHQLQNLYFALTGKELT